MKIIKISDVEVDEYTSCPTVQVIRICFTKELYFEEYAIHGIIFG